MPVAMVMPSEAGEVPDRRSDMGHMAMRVDLFGGQPAEARAETVAERAVGDIRARGRGALPFDMVVVAFLHGADLGLETQDLHPVLAHRAVGRRHFAHLFGGAFGKGLEHLGMVAEIARPHPLDFGVGGGDAVGEAVDAVDQDAREEEIGKHDHPPVGQAGDMGQTGLDKRKGDAGIARLAPAKAHAFPEHAGDLGHVGIGIGVRGAAADHDKAGLVQRHGPEFGIGAVHGLLHAGTGGGDHLGIDAKLSAIADLDPMARGIGVEHGGNVVLGVHRGKEHARHGQDAGAALFAQPVEPVPDHRIGEFEIAVVDLPVGGEIGRQAFGQHLEFVHRSRAARPVAADHHPGADFRCRHGCPHPEARACDRRGPDGAGAPAGAHRDDAPALAPVAGRPACATCPAPPRLRRAGVVGKDLARLGRGRKRQRAAPATETDIPGLVAAQAAAP